MWLSIAPWFGYLASLMLILALIVNNDLKFRWYNLVGNIAFIVYGVILMAVPVLITNGILLFINIYYLQKVYRQKENFDLIEFLGEEKLAVKFLRFYADDIRAYFPAFEQQQLKNQLNFVVLRDLVIANMFSAHITPDGDAQVQLNYTVPRYRDYKIGRYLFEQEKQFLINKGIRRIVYTRVDNKHHRQFLQVMGFHEEQIDGMVCMTKHLAN